MKIVNFGSLNLDYIYRVEHIGGQGETLAASSRDVFCGGKGLNQSIALARAGAKVYHAGCIGEDGSMLLTALEEAGVDCTHVRTLEGPSGHAVIQVEDSGQNAILLFGGANQTMTSGFVDEVLGVFDAGDILLLQNEINLLSEIVDKAYARGLKIALNPSPYNDRLQDVDLNKISIFLLNEVEGEQMTGEREPANILQKLTEQYSGAEIVLTLGEAGALYGCGQRVCRQEAYSVQAVDTTGAGDTFTGYFLASLTEGREIPDCLRLAAKAASIAVTRSGAAPSIPLRAEAELF
ncbi:MAG: ribokinase [Firmicutes bacterium]|nr:ribokinase [Bacillota bacterium]